jgi:hypothetical protein
MAMIKMCACNDTLRFRREPGVLDVHCLRHGLSWAYYTGRQDFP